MLQGRFAAQRIASTSVSSSRSASSARSPEGIRPPPSFSSLTRRRGMRNGWNGALLDTRPEHGRGQAAVKPWAGHASFSMPASRRRSLVRHLPRSFGISSPHQRASAICDGPLPLAPVHCNAAAVRCHVAMSWRQGRWSVVPGQCTVATMQRSVAPRQCSSASGTGPLYLCNAPLPWCAGPLPRGNGPAPGALERCRCTTHRCSMAIVRRRWR